MDRVASLEHFPFSSLDELRASMAVGTASPALHQHVAQEWAFNGPYVSKSTQVLMFLLASGPYAVFVAWVVFAALEKPWILLLTPVFLVYWLIAQPSMRKLLGPLSSLLHLAGFIGLIVGVITKSVWLWGTCLALLVIWFCQNQLSRSSRKAMLKAALEHEDLFALLWKSQGLRIDFASGDTYDVESCYVAGNLELYKHQQTTPGKD